MARLPVENLSTRLAPLNLGGTDVHHLPEWSGYNDTQKMAVLRQIAETRGRDPRLASLAVDIIKKAKVEPRDYKGQAAALLKWVQDPKNIYYVNEPGERLQDPIFTIKQGWGDCDDQILVLSALYTSVRLPWKLVIAGTDRKGKKIRYIEGDHYPRGGKWSHIYMMVGTPPFHPSTWFFCETTIKGVPLGWDVVSGSKKYLPEMDIPKKGPPQVIAAPPPPARFRPSRLPPADRRSPAYAEVYGASTLGPVIGAVVAGEMEGQEKGEPLVEPRKLLQAILTGVAISVGTTFILNKIGIK